MQPAEAVEKKTSKPRETRRDGIDAGLAKAERTIALIRQQARMLAEEREYDDDRLVKLVRLAFGSKFEGVVKNHPSYSPEDLAVFRKRGFNV
jgi:hypothetical protein